MDLNVDNKSTAYEDTSRPSSRIDSFKLPVPRELAKAIAITPIVTLLGKLKHRNRERLIMTVVIQPRQSLLYVLVMPMPSLRHHFSMAESASALSPCLDFPCFAFPDFAEASKEEAAYVIRRLRLFTLP